MAGEHFCPLSLLLLDLPSHFRDLRIPVVEISAQPLDGTPTLGQLVLPRDAALALLCHGLVQFGLMAA